MSEQTTDNEFYVVVWEDKEYGTPSHTFVHLRNGESIFDYMLRVHKIPAEEIDQIYHRIFVRTL